MIVCGTHLKGKLEKLIADWQKLSPEMKRAKMSLAEQKRRPTPKLP